MGKKTFEPTASCSVVSVGGAVTASVTTPVAVSLKEVSGGVPRVSLVSFSMSTESERLNGLFDDASRFPIIAVPTDACPVDTRPVHARPIDACPVDARPIDACPVECSYRHA